MPLDPRVKRFLDALAAGNPPNARTVSVPQRRAQLVELMKLGGAEVSVGPIEDRTIPGPAGPISIRVYSPELKEPATQLSAPLLSAPLLPGLMYFHGGGLVAGSIETHASIARALCRSSGCRVVAVDYRLAPEHPFPAGAR